MNLAKAYTGFFISFFAFASIPCIFRAMTDAPGDGLFLGKRTANAFGLLRINWFHAVLHAVLSLTGFWAIESVERSRTFARLNFAVCTALVVLGRVTKGGTRHIPANTADDIINGWVALMGFVIGFTPLANKTIGRGPEPGSPSAQERG